jgi:hypothetical protein
MNPPSTRRLLVVAAHCAGGPHQLEKLPCAAEAFFDVLTDGERGCCAPLQSDGLTRPGYLDNPTIDEANTAIEAALDTCAKKGKTLVLAWLGHGHADVDTLYLLPRDADFVSPTRKSFKLIVRIAEVILGQKQQPLASLILLLDTCYSAGAVPGVANCGELRRSTRTRRHHLQHPLRLW